MGWYFDMISFGQFEAEEKEHAFKYLNAPNRLNTNWLDGGT